MALGSLAFVVAGGFLVSRPDAGAEVAGVAGLAFFGLCLVISMAMLVRPPLVVAFGPDGIAVPTSAFNRRGAPVVPWSAIEGLEVYRLRVGRGQRCVGLVPKDPADPLWTTTRTRRANRRLSGFPLSIPLVLIDEGPEDLAGRFRRYHRPLPLDYQDPPADGGRV